MVTQVQAPDLSTEAWEILKKLKVSPLPASPFKPSVLDELRKARLIRDLNGGRIGINGFGLDTLKDRDSASEQPAATEEATDEASASATSEPEASAAPTATEGEDEPAAAASEPAAAAPIDAAGPRKPTPAANGVLNPKTLASLQGIATQGGTVKRNSLHHFTVDKLLLEGLIEFVEEGVAITPAGIVRLEQEAARLESSTGPETPPVSTAPAGDTAACNPDTQTCSGDCPTARALNHLIGNSPALRAMVERFQAVEADQQRLRSLDS